MHSVTQPAVVYISQVDLLNRLMSEMVSEWIWVI